MNALEEAAFLLENNWCTGDLTKGDKFCAVGALGHVLNDVANMDPNIIYDAVGKSVEGKTLAHEIIDRTWDDDVSVANWAKRYISNNKEQVHQTIDEWFDYATSIIWRFNDAQESSEPVVEMMKQAAKRLDF